MTLFTIAPIGTCRVHAPLRRGAERRHIRLALARNYGYVHTSSEALQQLQFMFGEKDLSADVRALTFRPVLPVDFDCESWGGADFFLVEISSRKRFSIDGHPIQMNYMARYFGDFFADKNRSRQFFSMAKPDNLIERNEWLEQELAFQHLSPEDRSLLTRIQRRDLSDSEILAEMQQIADLVGKDKLAFVTHVNADGLNSIPVAQRFALITVIQTFAKRMNVPCYDPTALMRKLGQANALEKGGLDLTHYTNLFSDRLCEEWYTDFVLPRLNASRIQTPQEVDSGQNEDTADSLEASWNAGRVLEVSRRLRNIIRKGAGGHQHRLLLGRMQYELGDFEGAADLFESSGAEPRLDEKTSLLLAQCYFETGRYEQATRLASVLISDEWETPTILRICAESAKNLDDAPTALAMWKRLFRIAIDKSDASEAATSVIRLLESSEDAKHAIQWANEVRETLPLHEGSFLVLWKRALIASDREALLELACEPVDMGTADAIAVAKNAADRGFAMAAALLSKTQGLTRSGGNAAAEWITSRVTAWLEEGSAALASGDLMQAADKIQARAQINPSGNALIRAQRQLERQMRQDVRAALVTRDYEQALNVITIASQTLMTFPELVSFRIRVAEGLGDIRTALVYLRDPSMFDDIEEGHWIRLARLAMRGGYYHEAIDVYARLLASSSSDPSTHLVIERQIPALRSGAIRSAREAYRADDYERAWALLERLQFLDPDGKDVLREKKHVLAALYSKVKSLDATNDADRLALGEAILRLEPDDSIGLKAAATGAMRTHRFDLALKYWKTLRDHSVSPNLIDGNIQKCEMFIDREKRKKAA